MFNEQPLLSLSLLLLCITTSAQRIKQTICLAIIVFIYLFVQNIYRTIDLEPTTSQQPCFQLAEYHHAVKTKLGIFTL
jgi:hypothetical protein